MRYSYYSNSPGPAEIFLFFFFIIIALLPQIFYLINMQNTLKAVRPHNRKMEPGQVWLMLIPLFGLVWQFIMVNKMADSLKAEFAERKINVGEDRPGVNLGITYCILLCCSIIPFLGVLAALGGLVVWIIYWVKIAEFKSKLIGTQANDQILDVE